MKKIILDLCGGTGSWSEPYRKAGYDVRVITLPDFDVTDKAVQDECVALKPYGILAAPPCTMFSRARSNAKTPRDLEEGMRVVIGCLEIIWRCQYGYKGKGGSPLKFWALENPTGLLRWFLGKPALTFNPYDFGDRYRKPTDLWGSFNVPKMSPVVLTGEELERMGNNSRRLPTHPICKAGDRACRRAITPPLFAQAFFNANR